MSSPIMRPLVRPASAFHLHVRQSCRPYATPSAGPPAPPLLLKIRSDLKTAMKERDHNRLNVLKALIAEVTNAAKTSTPIKSDMQLLSLLRKRAAAARAASAEFQSAGREDLVEKEEQQASVIEEYAGGVATMSEVEIRKAVEQALESAGVTRTKGKVSVGELLKTLLAPGGTLDGKPVERSEVARVVKEVAKSMNEN